jgi:hypothetical protein
MEMQTLVVGVDKDVVGEQDDSSMLDKQDMYRETGT